jgi:mono/diheme cytochrome c family protein
MRRIHVLTAMAVICAAFVIVALPTAVQGQGDAAKVFKTNCVLCHAADGSGDSPTGKALKAKDLRAPEPQGKSDAELSEVIAKGKGKMPAFGAKLSADVIKSLVAHIRDLAQKK